MRDYPVNSPEAMARILAMFIISDGVMDERELDTIEELSLFELIGIERKRFLEVLMRYCDDISAEADDNGLIHLIDPERVDYLFDQITDYQKRVLICALALDLCKADDTISQPEMALLRHMMKRWHLTLEILEREFSRT